MKAGAQIVAMILKAGELSDREDYGRGVARLGREVMKEIEKIKSHKWVKIIEGMEK